MDGRRGAVGGHAGDDGGRRRRGALAALAALASALTRPLLGEPLALPPALVARHPELAAARFRRGGLPPRVGGWALGARSVAAITLWRTIFVAPGVRLDPALLLHELGHVHQFGASAAFPIRYLWASLRRGYANNPFEADADLFAATRLASAAGGAPAVPDCAPHSAERARHPDQPSPLGRHPSQDV